MCRKQAATIAFLLTIPATSALAEAPPVFVASWSGASGTAFSGPWGISVDADSSVYVADSGHGRIVKFTRSGTLTAQWLVGAFLDCETPPGTGSVPAGLAAQLSGHVFMLRFLHPGLESYTPAGQRLTCHDYDSSFSSAIAVSPSGEVYVASFGPAYPQPIQIFDSDLHYLRGMGTGAPGRAMAFDAEGNLYVAGYGSVRKFDPNGGYLFSFGSGSLSSDIYGLAVDPDDNVYVSDTGHHRIQKFDPMGGFLMAWGDSGSAHGQFNSPRGIAVDSDRSIYVVDSGNNRVEKFRPLTWTITASSGINGAISPSGAITVPNGASQSFTITPDAGYVVLSVVVDGSSVGAPSSYTFTNVTADHSITVTFMQTSSGFMSQWGSSGSGDGQFDYPRGVALDAADNVYVADTGNNRIQKFTSSGTFLTKWGGTYGSGDGQLAHPYGVAIDADGFVYVADAANSRIQKFTPSGTFVAKWGEDQLNGPYGVGVSPGGDVYVADTFNSRIAVFTSTGVFVNGWGGPGMDVGEFGGVNDVAFDAEGNVYEPEEDNDRIQKFTGIGTFLVAWGSHGGGGGEFDHPTGVATDAVGAVYVADVHNSRIQAFTNTGALVTQWGTPGSGPGQFNWPQRLAFDRSGNVYVADTYNHRIQKFRPMVWSISATAGFGGTISPSGTVFGPSGGNQTFVVTPLTGYSIAGVVVDGVSVGGVSTYSFTNVIGHHTIMASFAEGNTGVNGESQTALSITSANPLVGRHVVVDVTLPIAAPATLELVDVCGRLVASSQVGGHAGWQSITLAEGQPASPGLYFLRLTQDGQMRTGRVIVMQ